MSGRTPEFPVPVTRLPEAPDDDLDRLLDEDLADPEFRAAYEDAEVREVLLRRLIEARRAAGLTQGTVAKRMGTTQSAVSELEGGVADPRLSTLQRFARAIGCRIAAWVAPAAGSGDDAFEAFVQHEAGFLTSPSRYAPEPFNQIISGRPLLIQIVGVARHIDIIEPSIYFAGRLAAGNTRWAMGPETMEIRDNPESSEIDILDSRVTA